MNKDVYVIEEEKGVKVVVNNYGMYVSDEQAVRLYFLLGARLTDIAIEESEDELS